MPKKRVKRPTKPYIKLLDRFKNVQKKSVP